MRLVEVAVAQDDVVHTLVYTGFSLMTQVVECLAQTFLTLRYLEEDRQLLGVEALIADVTEYIKLCVGQYGLRQAHHLTVRGIGCQDVRTYGTDILCETHHQLLADGVDGRVRHLRKLLTEVVECGRSLITASGVSLPIAATGSCPAVAIGMMVLSMSS